MQNFLVSRAIKIASTQIFISMHYKSSLVSGLPLDGTGEPNFSFWLLEHFKPINLLEFEFGMPKS